MRRKASQAGDQLVKSRPSSSAINANRPMRRLDFENAAAAMPTIANSEPIANPELADLQLVGIYQNLRAPSGSIAVFREKDGGKRHKLRAGDQVGRSRLVQIRERDVVFTIEDFGFERQETLSLRKQEDVAP